MTGAFRSLRSGGGSALPEAVLLCHLHPPCFGETAGVQLQVFLARLAARCDCYQFHPPGKAVLRGASPLKPPDQVAATATKLPPPRRNRPRPRAPGRAAAGLAATKGFCRKLAHKGCRFSFDDRAPAEESCEPFAKNLREKAASTRESLIVCVLTMRYPCRAGLPRMGACTGPRRS